VRHVVMALLHGGDPPPALPCETGVCLEWGRFDIILFMDMPMQTLQRT